MQNNCLSKKITCSFIAICIGILSFLLPSSLIHAEDRRTVKVGYYTMTGFQNYDEDTKEFSGYSYDYLMAIAQYANWNYEFYPIKMSEGYQMLVDGQLDLMCSITKTEGMEAYVDFASIPSGTNITELVMMPDRTDVSYGDFEAISQLKVGLANINSEYNTPFLQYCEDNSCTPELIYYDTQAEVTQAMKDGAVDASLATNLQNVPAHIIAKFNPQPIYYVTGKGNTELLSELNKAINQVETLDEDFEETLENKYYGDISESTTVLTKAEQEFVKDNPVITVSYDTDWYPISYQNTDGEFAGAFKSIYQMISEKSGLQFKFIPSTDSTDTDMIAEVPYSYPWANTHGWDITTHVVDLMITAMYNGNDSDIQKIAVLPNTYLTDLIKETYGDQYTYIEYASTEEAVDAVKNHEADCIYFSSYEASYYTSLYEYRNLNTHQVSELNHSISIGVSQEEDSRLISIIMKSLSSVGSNEIDTVFNEAQVTAQKMDLGNLIYRNPTTALFIAIFTTIVIAVVGGIIIHNHSLKKKNRQLHTAANAKTEFLSNMSHDIRTPINTIIGITELAEDDIQDPKKMEEHIQGIQTSSKYLLSIINDILDMSRIESGKFTLDYAWTPAYEVIHSCVEIMIPEMNKKHIHFIYPDGERVKNVEYYVDPLKTKRMVMNLLNNAYKFTGEDGTVTLSIKNQSFDETTSTDLVSIEDTGCGMSEEFLKKIFTPFAQEHNQYSDAQPGTGLGLSIAKQTAKAMGGDILVESKLDVGTKFTIIFPYQYRIVTHEKAEEETIHENIKDEHISAVLKGKKILLFEDNQINANIEKKILERKECTVEIAENGKIGLEKFKDSKEGFYDAILMDIRMPELNGLDAATSIRNLERTDANKVPIIAMSANAYKEDIQKSLEAGMNDHLAKPVDSVLLYETLAKYLS